MQDKKLSHRTRNNTAAIRGLTSAIDQHMSAIRMALLAGKEDQLQITLADCMMDAKALEVEIVSQES